MIQFRRKESNCYVYLMGGLGNQLFQIAAGLRYTNQAGGKLILDDSFGNFRKNSLGKADVFSFNPKLFSAVGSAATKATFTRKGLSLLLRISLQSKTNVAYKIIVVMLKVIASIFISVRFGKRIRVWSSTDLGFEDILKSVESRYLIGYFQTFRFVSYKIVEDALRSLSIDSISIKRFKKLAAIEKPLVVHVRLGDYLEESNFGVLSSSYYERAISLMISRYRFKHLWIFSDEIDKAKSMIPKQYLTLCRWMDDGDSAAETLEKMRLGSGYVIANSSLSWWGSFLSYTSNAPIVAPQPWFTGMDDPKELIPDNWIKINR